MGLPMSKLPHGPRVPPPVQLLKWVFAPLPFMQACADRYGDTFTVRLLGLPPMVFFTDPGAIRQIFTGDPEQFRSGQANAVFEMFFGPNSLLLLDGARHRRERRLLMPPFHGERMRLYGEMMCEIADRSIDAWPVDRSFPVHARLQDITLEVMLRVVFGVADESRLVRLGKAAVEALDLWDVGNPLRPIKALWRFGRVRREIDALLQPNSFDPRRFMGGRTDPYTFFPFGGGVRHCLGAAFATYEAKIVLARVLSRVNLRPDPDYAVRVVRRGLALGPSSGLPVIRMAMDHVVGMLVVDT